MSESDNVIASQRLSEFAGVDFSRSYVLSWNFESDTLIVDIDLCLSPEHPFYEKPRPAEKACIRPTSVEFPCCDGLSTEFATDGEPVDIAGNLGHGAITNLRRLTEHRYEISGEFGTVFVDAEQPLLKFKGS